MIIVKTKEEIELMRQSALIVSKTLGMLAKEVKEGVTTNHLDTIAEEFIRDHGALPGFKGLYDCPSTLLCSVNEAVVHGLPTDIPLKDGDIVFFITTRSEQQHVFDLTGKKPFGVCYNILYFERNDYETNTCSIYSRSTM